MKFCTIFDKGRGSDCMHWILWKWHGFLAWKRKAWECTRRGNLLFWLSKIYCGSSEVKIWDWVSIQWTIKTNFTTNEHCWGLNIVVHCNLIQEYGYMSMYIYIYSYYVYHKTCPMYNPQRETSLRCIWIIRTSPPKCGWQLERIAVHIQPPAPRSRKVKYYLENVSNTGVWHVVVQDWSIQPSFVNGISYTWFVVFKWFWRGPRFQDIPRKFPFS